MNFLNILAQKLTPKVIVALAVLLALIFGALIWSAVKKQALYTGAESVNVVVPEGVVVDDSAKKPAEVAGEVHQVPGYEKAPITDIEALPDANGNIEYWSAKTDRGYVTVKAK